MLNFFEIYVVCIQIHDKIVVDEKIILILCRVVSIAPKEKMAKTKNGGQNLPEITPIKRRSSVKYFINVLVQFMDGMNMSGRIAGNVYQKNGIKRNYASPGVFTSEAAGRAKGLFGSFQSQFGTLSQAVQIAWNSATFYYTDRFARVKLLSGRSAYVRLNVNLTNSGQTLLTTPPTVPSPAEPLLGGAITADDSAHTISLAYTANALAGVVLVYATAPQRSTIFQPTSRMLKLIGSFDGTTAGPQGLTLAYNSTFGADAIAGVGNKVFLELVTISDTGNASPVVGYVTQIVA